MERSGKMKNLIKVRIIILSIGFLVFICFSKLVISKLALENSKNNKIFVFDNTNMKAVKINIKYENTALKLLAPIYAENNRYYIPITEVLNKMGGTISKTNSNITLQLNQSSIQIDGSKDEFIKNQNVFKLKKKLICNDNLIYITMFDFAKMFDLKAQWNIEDNTLSLYKNREKDNLAAVKHNGRPALIRLEDITAGGRYKSEESLEKLRIVCDYLYREGIPFHIAWIPRYINVTDNIDNDLIKNYSMINADFVFTLDYFIDKGGIIGLHGYTHQYGKTESVDGIEFHRAIGDGIPKDIEYAQNRINKALETASQLKIPCNFFEAPHYAILYPQLDVVEKNFEYIYEPYSEDGGISECKNVFCKHGYEKNIKYIPTPLNYVDGKNDCKNMLNKISSLNKNLIGSFFYHPYIEFDDIEILKTEDGYSCYKYSNESVLHQIINRLKVNGFTFCKINDIK